MIRALLRALPLVFLFATSAPAQDALRIAAVVNDQIVSVYDLEMRISLLLLFSGLPDTTETRQRLALQALRTLVDDELKRQEAKRQKIKLGDKDIAEAMRHLEQSNGLKEGGLQEILERRRIEKTALTKQIEAQLYWGKLVSRFFGPQVQISDEEVNAALAEIERHKGKPEYRVSEIFLPVDRPENDGDVLALANRLVLQFQRGTGFEALARNFSKSATAEHGGDLGWNAQGQLDQDLDKVVVQLQPGQISTPIRTSEGYYIVLLKDRRVSTGLATEPTQSPVVNVQQFFLPIEKTASPIEVASGMDAARRIAAKSKTCEDLDKAGKAIGSPLSGNLGDMRIDALAPQQRTLIRALPPLTPSQPMQTEDGIIVLMVCKRQDERAAQPDQTNMRGQVERRLIEERLDMASQQYLKDLRRNAFVDIRI